ncbi:hypothetical protein D3C80_2186890 [compost metagenome]
MVACNDKNELKLLRDLGQEFYIVLIVNLLVVTNGKSNIAGERQTGRTRNNIGKILAETIHLKVKITC